MANAADCLRSARKRIEKPENWIQGRYFWKEPDGTGGYKETCCFLGALQREVPSTDMTTWCKCIDYLRVASPGIGPSVYNDTHTHSEVLAWVDKAILLAEVEQE